MKISGVSLYFLPVKTRVPYQFGAETMTEVVCARVGLCACDNAGKVACGWGETPLNIQWMWPGGGAYEAKLEAVKAFCILLAGEYSAIAGDGHPLELGYAFLEGRLSRLLEEVNRSREARMPLLAALVCCSAFDIAMYDAFGVLVGLPVYGTLSKEYLARDLSAYLEPVPGSGVSFEGKYPADYLTDRAERLPVWHSVGGTDPLDEDELTGSEPRDGYPVTLREWVARDGLKCLKIKLCGDDFEKDFARLVKIGRIAIEGGADWLCADFNCTASSVDYVCGILDRLLRSEPRIYGMLLYIEQPFPYELEENRIDVHAISARKPLFLDESAHDWRLVRLGRELGWTGVALKTCKTQTGALLSLCWARAHGMSLMVQDLTNPMLALIPHAQLAAHAGTVMGLECNAAQFYPEASSAERAVHPGLYDRKEGVICLDSLDGAGFSYRVDEIGRRLPEPVAAFGDGLGA